MIEYLYLGRVDYAAALALQAEIVELRRAGRIGNTLLLLEHEPVLTLGRNAGRSNVLASDELLARRGVTLHQISRGGDVTYHGPGQLIGYPIFDLRSLKNASGSRPGTYIGPVDFVRRMEEALIRMCGTYGVRAGRIAGLTGVWCGLSRRADGRALDEGSANTGDKGSAAASIERKIAAIGIHVSRGIVSHGFAFNLTTDLGGFALINPCGITDRPVTSLKLELGREISDPTRLPSLEAAAHEAARQFGMVFEQPVLAVENLSALRARPQEAAANETPAQDTPLQLPRELEQLIGREHKPVNA
jgi:lipoyl(octanoyl) transferase